MKLLPALLLAFSAAASAAPLQLRYDKPATAWETEALPLGNGRLGAMVFGGVRQERLQFNEDTLWVGDETTTGDYQNFGDLVVHFEGGKEPEGSVQGYQRVSDLGRAVQTVTFSAGGVDYRREYLASHPAGVIVLRFTASAPGAYTGTVALTDAHHAAATAHDDRLTCAGSLAPSQPGQKSYKVALNYESQVRVLHEGGTVAAAADQIRFDHVNSLTILLAAGTDFVNNPEVGWRGELPHGRVTGQIDAAAGQPYERLLAAHVEDYRRLFDRVSLDLGPTAAAQSRLPTDERLLAFRKGAPDPELEALLFQYGRYLLIASSRGSLPANLQGLWNQSNQPPWHCDFHSDINLEMNYWPADVTNLSECFQPFVDYLWSIRGVRTRITAQKFHVRGWTLQGENGPFGGGSWNWILSASAWYCQNLWTHYAFTGDKEFLRERAYPIMKEVCEYWQDTLQPLPDGTLVAPKNFSPEQMGYDEPGCSFDQELVWDLFTNYGKAAAALHVDADYAATVAGLKARLLVPKVGHTGLLQEWMTDRDDAKTVNHRHLSHLVGLYPGDQLQSTPALAAAARNALAARGDGSTGWSMAWKISLWARLHEGDHAGKLSGNLLKNGMLPNLFDTCPPFQIDGNFGYTAGLAEMLLQSQRDGIDLLPALPAKWPAGKVTGLRARGGFVVDEAWNDGRLTSAVVRSVAGGRVRVRCGEKAVELQIAPGQAVGLDGELRPVPAAQIASQRS